MTGNFVSSQTGNVYDYNILIYINNFNIDTL